MCKIYFLKCGFCAFKHKLSHIVQSSARTENKASIHLAFANLQLERRELKRSPEGETITHLAVNWRRSEAKLLDKGHQRALQDPTEVFGGLLGHCVVALLGLLFCHHGAVLWRSCRGGNKWD